METRVLAPQLHKDQPMIEDLTIAEINDIEDPEVAAFFSRSITEVRLKEIGLSVHLPTILKVLDEHVFASDKTVIVARSGGKVVGMLIGGYLNFPFTITRMITDVFFRVDTSVRGTGVGSKIIAAFQAWGARNGAKLMMIGINQYIGRDPGECDTAMQKMGFKLFNQNYAMEI